MDTNHESKIEDYGSPETDDTGTDTGSQAYVERTDGDVPASTNQAGEDANFAVNQGRYSGGTEGTSPGAKEGEYFGEFEDTGTGVDLTRRMEDTTSGE